MEIFFPLLKTVFELINFDDFQCFYRFLFHLFHIKTHPLEDFFHPRKQQKESFGVRSGEWRGWAQGSCRLWSGNAGHSAWCGQLCSSITHHAMGKHAERVFKKNSLNPNTASHNNASWHTDAEGFLERSPTGGSLSYKGLPSRR